MDIELLKNALAAARGVNFVLVTEELFWRLYDAMELTPRKGNWRAPSDPACKKIMNTLLARHRLPRAELLTEVTWHLTQHDNIRVIRGLSQNDGMHNQSRDFEISFR